MPGASENPGASTFDCTNPSHAKKGANCKASPATRRDWHTPPRARRRKDFARLGPPLHFLPSTPITVVLAPEIRLAPGSALSSTILVAVRTTSLRGGRVTASHQKRSRYGSGRSVILGNGRVKGLDQTGEVLCVIAIEAEAQPRRRRYGMREKGLYAACYRRSCSEAVIVGNRPDRAIQRL